MQAGGQPGAEDQHEAHREQRQPDRAAQHPRRDPLEPQPEAGADDDLRAALDAVPRASVIVIGAKGRVGSGARDLCTQMGLKVTAWDMEETAHGGPFPEILTHGIFLNCILATPGVPVFVPAEARTAERALRVIGDIACDPDSPFNPIPLYDAATSWAAPVTRAFHATSSATPTTRRRSRART